MVSLTAVSDPQVNFLTVLWFSFAFSAVCMSRRHPGHPFCKKNHFSNSNLCQSDPNRTHG